MYVIDTRRSRCASVGKQERQAITIRNSKVRRNESNPSLDKNGVKNII